MFFFCKLLKFIEKTNQKVLHYKMLTLQNVKFEMSEYTLFLVRFELSDSLLM